MIHKLFYTDRAAAEADLLAKGVLQETKDENDNTQLTYAPKTHAVVYIGKIVDVPATFDEEGEVLTDATFLDGYHVDVMLNEAVDFGENEIVTDNPVHTFA